MACSTYVIGIRIKKKSTGGTIKHLNQGILVDFSVGVPCLAEQQKIADCLSSLDEVIEKQKATLAAWGELKKVCCRRCLYKNN